MKKTTNFDGKIFPQVFLSCAPESDKINLEVITCFNAQCFFSVETWMTPRFDQPTDLFFIID